MGTVKFCIVVPWHNPTQREKFLQEWGVSAVSDYLIMEQDIGGQGCARTKNSGIRKAINRGAEVIIILDDDCFPEETTTLSAFAECHLDALKVQDIPIFAAVTDPPSRGTPYFNRTMPIPIAASMGFWTENPDYDAPRQLCSIEECHFKKGIISGMYFPLCGMNLAFRAEEWPWCSFINVPRFDDIWMGFIFQKHAYSQRKAFNLRGPTVRHSRQSSVWKNLRAEAINMERNETIWQEIDAMPKDLSHQEVIRRLGL
jgi:hypothetical protein